MMPPKTNTRTVMLVLRGPSTFKGTSSLKVSEGFRFRLLAQWTDALEYRAVLRCNSTTSVMTTEGGRVLTITTLMKLYTCGQL